MRSILRGDFDLGQVLQVQPLSVGERRIFGNWTDYAFTHPCTSRDGVLALRAGKRAHIHKGLRALEDFIHAAAHLVVLIAPTKLRRGQGYQTAMTEERASPRAVSKNATY